MIISTKGRYALRVMTDLAINKDSGYISIKTIAERQDVSVKYLEAIVSILNKAGMVESLRGKDGGYKLSDKPKNYTIGSIVRLTEGSLAPVPCLECGSIDCDRADNCLTIPIWIKMENLMNDYLDGITLDDVINKKV